MLTSSRRKDSFPESPACQYAVFSFQLMFDSAQLGFRQGFSHSPGSPRRLKVLPISSRLTGARGARLRGFHLVERLVRCVEQGSDGPGIFRKTGQSDADG